MMQSTQNLNTLVLEQSDNTATLYLNRPECSNAFNALMIEELNSTLDQVADQAQCTTLFLKAKGKHFSAGADLNWMRQQAHMSMAENIDDARPLAQLMQRLDTMPQVTIALVQGCAYGGALGLIACCDIAVCDPASRFCFSEVKLGLMPAVISPYINRAIGQRYSRALMLSAEVFHAQQAHHYGLIHRVCDDLAEMEAHYRTTCQEHSTHALQETKALLAHLDQKKIDHALIDDTVKAIAQIRTHQDAQERMASFLSRNKN
tara:strand:+ start:890 stop:1672 length:783 start_codon:yes stop_codon:yes gene_type:complete